jgi:hypothetical protein
MSKAKIGDTVYIVEQDRFGEVREILADGTITKVAVPTGKTAGEVEIVDTSQFEIILVTLLNILTKWLKSKIKQLFSKKK